MVNSSKLSGVKNNEVKFLQIIGIVSYSDTQAASNHLPIDIVIDKYIIFNRVGALGSSTPIIHFSPSGTFIPTFSTLSIYTGHNRYGYWKFLSHPHLHDICDNCF